MSAEYLERFVAEWRRVHGPDSTVHDLGDGRVAATAWGWRDIGVYLVDQATPVLQRYPDAQDVTVEDDTRLVLELEQCGAWLGWLDGEEVSNG